MFNFSKVGTRKFFFGGFSITNDQDILHFSGGICIGLALQIGSVKSAASHDALKRQSHIRKWGFVKFIKKKGVLPPPNINYEKIIA
jgi:hypothetical protein